MAEKQNIGFNERKVEQGLNNVQMHYDQLMNSIESYQETGVQAAADAWISVRAKDVLNKITRNLNIILTDMENKYKVFFDTINRVAEANDQDSDGIGFDKVEFKAHTDKRFKEVAKEQNSEGNVYFVQDEVSQAISQLNRFLTNRLFKNLDEIQAEIQGLAGYIAYGDEAAAAEVSSSVRALGNTIESNVQQYVKQALDNMQAAFEADAAANKATIQTTRETVEEANVRVASQELAFEEITF